MAGPQPLRSTDAAPFIEVRGLHKSYGSVEVLKSLDLVVPKGRIVTLLGPSGCGKTTTLRCIAGLETPDGGTVTIGGVVADDGNGKHLPPRERGLGIVFQSFALWPHMTVRENVAFPLRRKRVAEAEIGRRTERVLDLVGLAPAAGRYPGQLSGGQQQRVALARAVVGEPGAILYDEPLSNLDARLREQMRTEISDLHRRLNITAVYVTHDQEEAVDISDEIYVMQAGRVLQKGSPIEIFDRPRSKFVCEFFGQSNVFPVKSAAPAENGIVVATTSDGLRVAGLAPERAAAVPRFVAVRPHCVQLAAKGSGAGNRDAVNALPGRVVARRVYGSRSRYHVALNENTGIEADLPRPGPAFNEGDEVTVMFAARDCVCLEED